MEDSIFYDNLKLLNKNIPEYALPLDLKESNVAKFLDICKINVALKQTFIIYHIKIPLMSKEDYHLYNLTPIPIWQLRG